MENGELRMEGQVWDASGGCLLLSLPIYNSSLVSNRFEAFAAPFGEGIVVAHYAVGKHHGF